MMVEVQLDASAKLRAQARDSKSLTKADEIPTGIVSLRGYPRVGDDFVWNGREYRVVRFCWFADTDIPIATLE